MWTLIVLLSVTKCIAAYHDCDRVKFIYQKMGGHVSMIPQNCCIMNGVECHDGHVIEIRWSYQGLDGYIPREIGNLVHLKWLYLEQNILTGGIPSEIGNLVNLKEMSLARNQLVGGIPDEIGKLVNLEYLSLEGNKLIGGISPEIGNLVNLEILSLQDNQLTGGIPSEIVNLNNLESLNLSENQLNGNIPADIGNLVKLQMLNLRSNHLSASIPDSSRNLFQLTYLDLSNNHITGSVPGWIHGLGRLELLNLGQNHFSGDIPLVIGGRLNNLRSFFKDAQNNPRLRQEWAFAGLFLSYREFLKKYQPYINNSKDLLWIDSRASWNAIKFPESLDAYLKAEAIHLTNLINNMRQDLKRPSFENNDGPNSRRRLT